MISGKRSSKLLQKDITKDELFRSAVKTYSRRRYESSSETKNMKKTAVRHSRQIRKEKCKKEDEVVRIFKEKNKRGH